VPTRSASKDKRFLAKQTSDIDAENSDDNALDAWPGEALTDLNVRVGSAAACEKVQGEGGNLTVSFAQSSLLPRLRLSSQ
jgi:hypothetical protein